ncbi:MAG TPA: glycerophosphodiester phosphodiesterase family protein, partial [Pseudonocardiaceae bacterium]|nr:glycerophosphodiester phosphodiesterase family protein [Pseudonocardiaceae bacterium]
MNPLSHPFLDGPSPRAFAHRGWHVGDLADMENSLTAFRRAATEGYCYLETDVHTTRDGVVVVMHDSTLDRTTDSSGEIGQLGWASVRTARVGGREQVCRLADLLEELPDALINIDVKAGAAVTPVLDLLRRTGAWGRVCLASFSESRLQRLRAAGGPQLLTSLGPVSAAALRMRSVPPLPLPHRVRNSRSGVTLVRGELAQLPVRWCGMPVVDRALVRYAHHLGVEVHAWTVNRSTEMQELLDLGVDGLVTDRPD